MLNTFGYCLITHNDICNTVCHLGELVSMTQSLVKLFKKKISVKYPLFLLHVMLSVLFNRREQSALRNRHTYTHLFLYIYFYYMNVLPCMYVCLSHVCLMTVEVRRWHQILEQELQAEVSHYEGAGNQTWVPWRNPGFISPAPLGSLLIKWHQGQVLWFLSLMRHQSIINHECV